MKKTAILLSLVMILLCFTNMSSFAASALNPYTGFSMTLFDETTNANCTTAGGMLGASGANAVYTYKDIDFGDAPPVSVMLEIGGPAGSVFENVALYIDAPTGDPIATFNVTTEGWSIATPGYCEISQTILGVHDLYLKTAKSTSNFFNVRFTQLLTGDSTYKEYDPTLSEFADVSESKYLREINIIHELGLDLKQQTDKMYYPHLPVTRGKFARVVAAMVSENLYSGSKCNFEDVESGSEYEAAIALCTERGYILGYQDGTFRPNKFIEISEAIVVLSRVLGYDVYAELKGGFITGYMNVASQYGLLDGIPKTGALTEEVMARLLYNAIKAEYYDIETVTTNGVQYSVCTDGILSKNLGIQMGQGLVSANNFTSLASPVSDYDTNTVSIDGKDYNSGDSIARSLLGYNCEFFYREDGGKNTIISISPREGEVTEVSSADNEIFSITDKEVSYLDENGKEKHIDIEDGSYIIYNGVAIDDRLSAMITMPFRGYVRYIDNRNSRDTLFIYEYVNVEVGGVSIGENLIYDNFTKQAADFSKQDVLVFFTKNGNACGIADVLVGSNAILYKSKNTSGKTIYQYFFEEDIISGTVKSISDGKFSIDGSYYKVATEYKGNITIGMSADFKLNSFGEIVGISVEQDEMRVGFLLNQAVEKEDAFNNKTVVRILNANNIIEKLELNKSCTVDGRRYNDNTAVLSNAMCGEPIGYIVNAENKITMLDTIVKDIENEKDMLKKIVTADTAYYWGEAARVFSRVSGGLQEFVLNDNAKILCQWVDGVDAEDYTWEPTSELIGDPMTGVAYSFDEKPGFADIFIWKNVSKNYSDAFVVDGIGSVLNDEGDVAIKVYGYDGRKDVEYIVSENNPETPQLVSKLEQGDWIRAYVNSNNEITKIQILYLISGAESISYTVDGVEKTASALLNSSTASSGSLPTTRLTSGTVIDRNGKYVTIKHLSGDIEYIYLGSAVGVMYNSNPGSTPSLSNGVSADSIKITDRVFFNIVKRNTASIYIVR